MMPISLLFWVLVAVGLVFGFVPAWSRWTFWPLLVLIILLGYAQFGFHLSR